MRCRFALECTPCRTLGNFHVWCLCGSYTPKPFLFWMHRTTDMVTQDESRHARDPLAKAPPKVKAVLKARNGGFQRFLARVVGEGTRVNGFVRAGSRKTIKQTKTRNKGNTEKQPKQIKTKRNKQNSTMNEHRNHRHGHELGLSHYPQQSAKLALFLDKAFTNNHHPRLGIRIDPLTGT